MLEIIIVIAVLAVIITIGSQTIFVSLRSNKTAGERDSALKLAEETFEAVRMVVAENWLDLYKPPDGTAAIIIRAKATENGFYNREMIVLRWGI
ncbi:MAG: hypothetical protein UU20_C0004G0022 [Parcubacteria group bacterium GW2011_GWE2_40_8]|nr:MAG: hypothetical protein UU20_C0004G0022 [Parcubacteria group bacterium GW2011_GWE2_40_8]